MQRNIVVGITGGIAAYKIAGVCSKLKQRGYEVRVMMTKAATEFISPLTLQSLTGHRVIYDMFEHPESGVSHIEWADWADCVLIAPATANIIGKVRNGIADDFVSTIVMATKAPVIFAPAMNCNMYDNRIVQGNIEFLQGLQYHFVEPEAGYLACGYTGKGRLADEQVILSAVESVLDAAQPSNGLTAGLMAQTLPDLSGKRVLITAGPTREPIDPVRFLSNHSSGKMGYALAQAAQKSGAEVTLISGPVNISLPDSVNVIPVQTAQEMLQCVLEHLPGQDIVIKAAAVADYRPATVAEQKIKKSDMNLSIEFVKNPDILLEIAKVKTREQMIIGFAAESENVIENAQSKLLKKQLDMIVANDISSRESGFDVDYNQVIIIKRGEEPVTLPRELKRDVAVQILEHIMTIKSDSVCSQG